MILAGNWIMVAIALAACPGYALSARASQSFDAYYKNALTWDKKANHDVTARYVLGALQEGAKVKLSGNSEWQKYARLRKLSIDLSDKYKDKEKWDTATQILKQLLAADERQYGPKSFKLLEPIFHLENTYGQQAFKTGMKGKFNEAEALCERAITIGEKLPPQAIKDTNHQDNFQASINFLLILKDYKSTLKLENKSAQLEALQRRMEKMPVFAPAMRDRNTSPDRE